MTGEIELSISELQAGAIEKIKKLGYQADCHIEEDSIICKVKIPKDFIKEKEK